MHPNSHPCYPHVVALSRRETELDALTSSSCLLLLNTHQPILPKSTTRLVSFRPTVRETRREPPKYPRLPHRRRAEPLFTSTRLPARSIPSSLTCACPQTTTARQELYRGRLGWQKTLHHHCSRLEERNRCCSVNPNAAEDSHDTLESALLVPRQLVLPQTIHRYRLNPSPSTSDKTVDNFHVAAWCCVLRVFRQHNGLVLFPTSRGWYPSSTFSKTLASISRRLVPEAEKITIALTLQTIALPTSHDDHTPRITALTSLTFGSSTRRQPKTSARLQSRCAKLDFICARPDPSTKSKEIYAPSRRAFPFVSANSKQRNSKPNAPCVE